MKIKTLIIGTLLLAAFPACQREQLSQPGTTPSGEDEQDGYTYTFLLSGADSTKTLYGEDHIVWENGDPFGSYIHILRDGEDKGKNKSVGVEVTSENVVVKVKSDYPLQAEDVVYGYYPFAGDENTPRTAIPMQIPSEQTLGDADVMPMVIIPLTIKKSIGTSTGEEIYNAGTLRFFNLGSTVRFRVYSESKSFQGERIESIEFQSDKACAGSFTYDITSVTEDGPTPISGYSLNTVIVSGEGIVGTSKADAAVYEMVLAPGTYKGKFIVHTNVSDYTYDSSSKEREYVRGALKPLNFNLASESWTEDGDISYDTSIDSPREFLAFLKGTSESDTQSYTISQDLDMSELAGISRYPMVSASGFGGILDGKEHTINNLTSNLPLFATNSGSISNLIIGETCSFTVGSNIFGALVAVDNGGTYTSVRNKARVIYTANGNISESLIIGGLIGRANGCIMTSCTNSAVVAIQASGYSQKAAALGGIVGYAVSSTFESCINRGSITLNAKYCDMNSCLVEEYNNSYGVSIGGILGCGMDFSKDSYCSFNKCENETAGVITFSHNSINNMSSVNSSRYLCVGGILGRARGNMKTCKNWAPINVTSITSDRSQVKYRNYVVNVGGIAGAGLWCLSFESCTNDGELKLENDNYWSDSPKAQCTVGGICGREDEAGEDILDSKADLFANYCKMRTSITVRGKGTAAVGGIFGVCGKQNSNEVQADCTIDYIGHQGDIGGVVGYLDGKSKYFTIKGCSSAAAIIAEKYNGNDDGYFSVGGLIGRWGGATTSGTDAETSLTVGANGQVCAFTGSIASNSLKTSVGVILGCVMGDNKSIEFGSTGNKIQASGSFTRRDLSTVTINAGNIETYAIGKRPAGTRLNIYVTSPTD